MRALLALVYLIISWLIYRLYKSRFKKPFGYYYRNSEIFMIGIIILFPLTVLIASGYYFERFYYGLKGTKMPSEYYKFEYKLQRLVKNDKISESEYESLLKELKVEFNDNSKWI